MGKETVFLQRSSISVQICISENLSAQPLSRMHIHEALEFLYVTKGNIRCYLDHQILLLQPGDILFINSNVPHKTESVDERTDCTLLQFQNIDLSDDHLQYLKDYLSTTEVSYHVFRKEDPDFKEILQNLEAIAWANQSKNTAYEFFIASGIYAILGILHRRKFLSALQDLLNQESVKRLIPVFAYIDKNYAEHLTLEQLARCTGFHKAYFCRLFKQATGGTVVEYLNFVRVRNAEIFLRNDRSAIEAAYLAGFSSPSYFTKVFKKYRNCSPSAYKKICSQADKLFEDRVVHREIISL